MKLKRLLLLFVFFCGFWLSAALPVWVQWSSYPTAGVFSVSSEQILLIQTTFFFLKSEDEITLLPVLCHSETPNTFVIIIFIIVLLLVVIVSTAITW